MTKQYMSAKDREIARLKEELAAARSACGHFRRERDAARREVAELFGMNEQLEVAFALTDAGHRGAERNLDLLAAVGGDLSLNQRDERDAALRMLRAFLSMLWRDYVRRGEELEQRRIEAQAIAADNVRLRERLDIAMTANAQFSRRATEDQARLDKAERIAGRVRVMGRIVRDLTRVFHDVLEGNDLDFEQIDPEGMRWRVTGYGPLEFIVSFDGWTASVRNTTLTGRRALTYSLLNGYGLSAELLIAIEALFGEVHLTTATIPGHKHADLLTDEPSKKIVEIYRAEDRAARYQGAGPDRNKWL